MQQAGRVVGVHKLLTIQNGYSGYLILYKLRVMKEAMRSASANLGEFHARIGAARFNVSVA